MEWKIRLAAAIATAPLGTVIPEPAGSFVSGAHGSVVKMVGDISVSDAFQRRKGGHWPPFSHLEQQLRRV